MGEHGQRTSIGLAKDYFDAINASRASKAGIIRSGVVPGDFGERLPQCVNSVLSACSQSRQHLPEAGSHF